MVFTLFVVRCVRLSIFHLQPKFRTTAVRRKLKTECSNAKSCHANVFFSVTAALLQSPLINSAERKKMSIWGVQNDTFMRTMCQLCTHISHAPPTQHTVLFASPVPHTDLWLFAYILFLFGVLGSVLASSPMWPFRYELTTFLNVHICHAVNHKQMRFPYFT